MSSTSIKLYDSPHSGSEALVLSALIHNVLHPIICIFTLAAYGCVVYLYFIYQIYTADSQLTTGTLSWIQTFDFSLF